MFGYEKRSGQYSKGHAVGGQFLDRVRLRHVSRMSKEERSVEDATKRKFIPDQVFMGEKNKIKVRITTLP